MQRQGCVFTISDPDHFRFSVDPISVLGGLLQQTTVQLIRAETASSHYTCRGGWQDEQGEQETCGDKADINTRYVYVYIKKNLPEGWEIRPDMLSP